MAIQEQAASRAAEILLERIPEMRHSIVKRSVKDMVADKLMSLIGSGVLRRGDELPSERDLSAILSVSRETIRGAIQNLAARGLVDVSHGTRTRVARSDLGSMQIGLTSAGAINSYNIDAVHAARLLVERAVVAEAADRIDAETLLRLDETLAAQRRMLRDPVRFLIADREFHVAIYRSAANPLLSDFVIDLYTYMMEFRRVAVSRPGAIRKSYEDHLAIVAALRSRDRTAAVAAFERHINRIYATTRSLMPRSVAARSTKDQARPRDDRSLT